MNSRKALILGAMLGAVFGVLVATGQSVLAERDAKVELPLDDIRLFTDVYSRIKRDYVHDVEDGELLEGAIRGMLSSLDPHSAFLSQEEFKELQIGTSGEFGGLGIEVGMEDGFVKVISPIDDTPAQKAGIKAGDTIIKLDDTAVKGLSLNEAVKLMRGKRGTSITLTIIREGQEKPFDVVIKRDVIRVKSVRSRLMEPGFGYVRISNFQAKTTRNLIEAIDDLNESNENALQGLIVDLRNNPGGVLTGAVGVSDVFLDDGSLIVYTEGRVDDSKLKYNASTNDALAGAPIVVLINEGSASASEIVAGALQDHKRAIIMGRGSFGKGSVQTILPLKEDAALKLTTALYFTPSGRSIQAQGIAPDIVLQLGEDKEQDNPFGLLREADLKGHLEEIGKANKDQKQEIRRIALPEDSDDDAILAEALNVLKAMAQAPKTQG